jgi:MoaA/NifB/PqqE/SkfB family radical SAM enzyme
MPFVHQHVQPSGEIRFCCASLPFSNVDEKNETYNVNSNRLTESWNGPSIRKLRLDLIDGKTPMECHHCWERENKDHTKGNSMRLDFLNKIPLSTIQDRIDFAKENDGHVNSNPFNFQVMYGNLCNLSCKMCTPQYSTNFSKYFQNLGFKNLHEIKFNPNITLPDVHPEQTHYGVAYDWVNTNHLTSILSDFNKDIEELWIMGGEPTIIESTKNYIDETVDLGYSKNICLGISTNCTNINKDLLDQLKYFKHINFNMSLDGIDEIAYIQRTPSQWSHIEKNVTRLVQWRDDMDSQRIPVSLNVHSVITSLNFHHMIDFWLYLDNKFKNLTFTFMPTVGNSENFDINLVPKDIANQLLERVNLIKDQVSPKLQNALAMYSTLIENNSFADDTNLIHYQLDKIQHLHPDLNVKEIYSIYYQDSV